MVRESSNAFTVTENREENANNMWTSGEGDGATPTKSLNALHLVWKVSDFCGRATALKEPTVPAIIGLVYIDIEGILPGRDDKGRLDADNSTIVHTATC
jgi:hypothetical protein